MSNGKFPIKRILCAVDFSDASVRAFEVSMQLATLHGARIHLLHVIPRIVVTLTDMPVTTSRWTATEEEKAKRELSKLEKQAVRHGIRVTTEIRIGDIDLQILKAAKDFGADVLALGTHGRRGFERWAMGSIAERMLRYSPIPILIAGAGKRAGPAALRSMLITTDFSKGAADALGYGVAIAGKSKASITLLYVQDRAGDMDWALAPTDITALRKRLEALIPSRVRGWCKVYGLVERGKPYRMILKTIQQIKPSLVILNTHGHGFVNRILIGSVAERVVRGGAALAPMLLIPPRKSPASR